jgi:hypothetical protein
MATHDPNLAVLRHRILEYMSFRDRTHIRDIRVDCREAAAAYEWVRPGQHGIRHTHAVLGSAMVGMQRAGTIEHIGGEERGWWRVTE